MSDKQDLVEKINMSDTSATPQQIATFIDYVNELKSGDPPPMKKIMMRNGYSEGSASKPKEMLYTRKGWRELMALVPEMQILANVCRIATGSKNQEGKTPTDRDQLSAAKTVFKLNKRFPDKKKTVTLKQRRQQILDITNNKDED